MPANVLVVETPELGRLEHAQAASLVEGGHVESLSGSWAPPRMDRMPAYSAGGGALLSWTRAYPEHSARDVNSFRDAPAFTCWVPLGYSVASS
jgi:hypothetical protein